MTVYAAPGQPGSPATYASRYDNWIGGGRVAPVKGQYFENVSPVNGQVFTEIARSTAEDVELALDAAHAAAPAWGRTSITERSNVLLRRERKDRPAPGRASGEAAHDFFQPVKFEKLFCWTGHEYLEIELYRG